MSNREKSDSRSEQGVKIKEDRERKQSVSSQSDDSDVKKKKRNTCSKDKRKKSKHRSSSSSSSSSSVSSREAKHQNDREKRSDKWDKRYENGARPYRLNPREGRGYYKGRSGYLDNRKRNFGYRPYKHSGFYDRNRQNNSQYNRYNNDRRGRFLNHNSRRPPYDRSRSRSTLDQEHQRSIKDSSEYSRESNSKERHIKQPSADKVESKKGDTDDTHTKGKEKKEMKTHKKRLIMLFARSQRGKDLYPLQVPQVSSSTDTSEDEKKRKKARRKAKKLKKAMKKRRKKKRMKKKLKKKLKKSSKKKARNTDKSKEGASKDVSQEVSEKSKAMAPMTKEEWEKKQSVIRKIYDEETGRYRLIKGDGEVLEEIVSRERHKEINKQATKGDGEYFQARLKANVL
ncbi:ADP-ribosylation factor-like protein 6-interacting protein 4 [Anthophora plagiata]